MKLTRISKERKQTLIFLDLSKAVRGVTLITFLEISRHNLRYATAILIKAISEGMHAFPHLNSMVKYGSRQTLLCMHEINARLTISHMGENSKGSVFSHLLLNTDTKSVSEIYNEIALIKNESLKKSDVYQKIKLIQSLPLMVGKLLSKITLLNPRNQEKLFGSFAVTSLGKNSQKCLLPISGSTFSFNIGAPFREENGILSCNLVMVFDHRVLDGLEASMFLDKIKECFIRYEGCLKRDE